MSLFKNTEQPQLPALPGCEICRGYGFVGCDEAIKPEGVLVAKAWSDALACECPAGREFARFQAEWKALGGAKQMPKPIHEPNSFSKLLEEILTAPRDRPELPGPTPQIITQADVNREIQKRREGPPEA